MTWGIRNNSFSLQKNITIGGATRARHLIIASGGYQHVMNGYYMDVYDGNSTITVLGEVIPPIPPISNDPPAAPANLSVSANSSGNPKLTWSANSEPDLLGYHVYRSSNSSFSPNTKLTSSPITSTTYTDPEFTYSKFSFLMYYRVKAIDQALNLSPWSNQRSIKVFLLPKRASSEIPKEYSLSQNYPNPFNPVTEINLRFLKAVILQ